jgi:hypothetical protein
MTEVELSFLLGRSARAVREARITQTGSLNFLMQACRLIYYLLCSVLPSCTSYLSGMLSHVTSAPR